MRQAISQAEFGAWVGVSEARVSQFMAEGVLTRGESGHEWLIAYCERMRDMAAGRASSELGGLDLVQERAALAREQRLGIAIKNAVARGEYAPISLLAEVLATASQSVSERFEQLPGLLRKGCPELPDTGGHFTHQAYNYCRQRERERVFAVRGDPQPSKMVKSKATVQDVNWGGKIIKKGVRLWYVGTDTAKDLIYGRLCVEKPGAGYVHFSKDLPHEFYTQLTAEARVPQRVAAGEAYRWIKAPGARNEVLDCTVYAIFCTHMLGLHLYTGKMWQRLESIVQPPNGDLFAGGQQQEAPPADVSRETQVPERAPRDVPRETHTTQPAPAVVEPPVLPPAAAPLPSSAPAKAPPAHRAIQRPSRQSFSPRSW